MKCLCVLYDAECELCDRCRNWLSRQLAFVPLHFIALQSAEVAKRFPGIEALKPEEQLLVVSDDGAIYRGAHAWIMCLWALHSYRELARRLSDPVLLPFARIACELLSRNRFLISKFFKRTSAELVREFAPHVPVPERDRAIASG